MKKKYELIPRQKKSIRNLTRKFRQFFVYFIDSYEQKMEERRDIEIFNFNNRYKEYRKF